MALVESNSPYVTVDKRGVSVRRPLFFKQFLVRFDHGSVAGSKERGQGPASTCIPEIEETLVANILIKNLLTRTGSSTRPHWDQTSALRDEYFVVSGRFRSFVTHAGSSSNAQAIRTLSGSGGHPF